MFSHHIAKQTVKTVALTAAVCGTPLIVSMPARAYSVDPDASYDKVYVCKFVSTPEVREVLQTGQNPISVSVNAIKNFKGLGSSFNDAQGRSLVVAWDNGDGVEPPTWLCYGYETVQVPATPAVTDPCGSGNATWVVPKDTEEVVWELDAETGVLIAYVAQEDAVFSDGTFEHSYGTAIDSGVACPVTPPTTGGNVLGAQTTAPVTQLENTGFDSRTSTIFSAFIIGFASIIVLQGTTFGRKIRESFAQPFVVPTA